ncbi:Uncharacterized protein APZ42_031957 [Daphnia magna]|uniref:Uncharacterized protein n=2 Tax=Daphnia magna TaxID=35525 RepID=A0A164MFD6_9CRUS|nr:hypothetical protein OUZ56_027904 [Daphnia magna]KZS05010.1 Uncharacterized protein APZ42_031957 [Daphnia magna]
MSDPIPLAVCWLLMTCWTWTSASLVTTRIVGGGHPRQQQDTVRRIDPVTEPGEWKPIDYGHPMRDDPTLVYVPPVVDPVHYGIHSAEPLWPIRGSKLPQFHLPPEAMLSTASTDHRWRSRQAPRPKKTNQTSGRTSFQPSQQRVDHRPIHRLPQYHRHPVKSTAWQRYDHPTIRLIGRSPALGPSLPVVLPTFKPGIATTIKPVVLPMTRPGTPPMFTPEQLRNLQRVTGRHNSDATTPHRFFVNSARSYKNDIENSNGSPVINNRNSHHNGKVDSIDRSDDTNELFVSDVSHESMENETIDVSKGDRRQRKRARKPFVPFQFVIQSGYSKVRKYGNDIKELIR